MVWKVKMVNISILFALLIVVGAHLSVDGQEISMSPENWRIVESGGNFENHLGRPSLFIQSGTALVNNSIFENGTIEVDVAAAGPRAFAGIVFRARSTEELESIYLRLFKPGFSDAVQYVPRFQNVDGWQLYTVGYRGEANFDKNSWTRLKIEIEGRRARVFVGNAEKPQLTVEDLKRNEGKGEVGLWGLNGAYFANFRFTSQPLSSSFTRVQNEISPAVISRWQVSQVFPFSEVSFENYPEKEQLSKIKWELLNVEMPGFLNFSRYRRKAHVDPVPFKNSDDAIFAKKKIISKRNQSRKLLFGYSDRVAIFLNGTLVFTGNSAFRSRDDQFLGALGLHDAVNLELKKGENELLMLVADKMGGWGIQAQFTNIEGIEF